MASMCRTTKNKFIEDSQKIHGDKYDYSKVEYINNRTKVTIGCPIHGDYKKVPEKHISGSGCRKCLNESNTKTTEEFIEACKIIHKGLYGYDKTAYINSNENVIITCSIHGDYIQKAGSHRCGNGCLQCAKETTVFKRSHYIRLADKANLYLIKLSNEDEEFYKIGKTINNISKRFAKNSLPYKYEVITLINKDSGFIYDLEIKLHRKYKEYKYKPNIDFAGHTECYNLNLPIEEII